MPEPADGTIAEGVSVGGIPVGGMTFEEARRAVDTAYAGPVTLAVGTRRFEATARQLGFHVYSVNPVRQAFQIGRAQGTVVGDVAVTTRFSGTGLKRYLAHVERTFRIEPADATLRLGGRTPRISPDSWGHTVNRPALLAALGAAMRDPQRTVVEVPFVPVKPAVSARALAAPGTGYAVVIERDRNQLTLFQGEKVVRRFGVATGASSYPTPLGRHSVISLQRHPWWYPPDSAWAEGASPVPPGPSNPLGTRWMGLNAPGVGIHGTPNAASIGYSASHGCVRMRIPEAEWLFQRMRVGTTVWVVG